MALFFTSDQFFNHGEVIDTFHRPFKKRGELTQDDIEKGVFNVPEEPDCDKMNRTIIDNFNEIVHHGDMTFHIGNFGDLEFASELNGIHYLICGSLELKFIKEKLSDNFELYRSYVKENYNFKDVYKENEMNYIVREPESFYRLDKPVKHPLFVKLRMQEISQNPVIYQFEKYIENFTIFGGIGDAVKYDLVNRYVNPSVDVHHFRPVSERELCEYITYANIFKMEE